MQRKICYVCCKGTGYLSGSYDKISNKSSIRGYFDSQFKGKVLHSEEVPGTGA